MFHIENFLSNIKGVIDESETTRNEISQILTTVATITLPPHKITLVGTRIRLKVSPLQKLHIFLHKKKILDEIAKHPTLSKKVTDIL